MNRATNSVSRNKSKKTTLQFVKGMQERRSKCYAIAKQAAVRALQYSYIGRKLRTRNYESLNITRINLFCRQNDLNYSQFQNKMNKNEEIFSISKNVISNMFCFYPELSQQFINYLKNSI